MGRTPENKRQIVSELQESLQDTQMTVVIDFQGLSVGEMSDLRNRIRPTGAVCKITKNTLMRIAVDGNDDWQALTEYMQGPSAFMLVKDDLSAIKSYQEFQKATKKTSIRGAVMEGKTLSEAEVKALETCQPKMFLWLKLPELSMPLRPRLRLVSRKCRLLLHAVSTRMPPRTINVWGQDNVFYFDLTAVIFCTGTIH